MMNKVTAKEARLLIFEAAKGSRSIAEVQEKLSEMFHKHSLRIIDLRMVINEKEDLMRQHPLRRTLRFLFMTQSKEELVDEFILQAVKNELESVKKEFKTIKATIDIFGQTKRNDIDGDDEKPSPYNFR